MYLSGIESTMLSCQVSFILLQICRVLGKVLEYLRIVELKSLLCKVDQASDNHTSTTSKLGDRQLRSSDQLANGISAYLVVACYGNHLPNKIHREGMEYKVETCLCLRLLANL